VSAKWKENGRYCPGDQGREALAGRDAVPAKLHRSTVVLTDQITESCLGEPDASPKLGRALEDPLKLLWGHVRGVRRPLGRRFHD